VDAGRDLGRVDPWHESLERSRARRDMSKRRSRRGRGSRGQPVLRPIVRIGALLTLGGLAAASASGFGGAQTSSHRAHLAADRVRHVSRWPSARGASSAVCRPAVGTAGYVNPLAHASVRPERIDQGVDYAGSGTLTAIGAARIAYVGTSDTGWPGAFIEYRLRGGVDAGCYVYYAEGVIPVPGLHPGEQVAAGEPIATIIQGYPSGTEVGWGAGSGTKTYAARTGQWTASDDQDSIASAAGKSFSALLSALCGPPGKVEG
jgi:hypothetical protein